MQNHATKILVGILMLGSGIFLTVDGTFKNGLTVDVKSAYARIGRPATPASAAGVHRRHIRRSYYHDNNYDNNNYYHNNNNYGNSSR